MKVLALVKTVTKTVWHGLLANQFRGIGIKLFALKCVCCEFDTGSICIFNTSIFSSSQFENWITIQQAEEACDVKGIVVFSKY